MENRNHTRTIVFRNYFVEEAKTQFIVFRGTKEECESWCDDHAKEYEDKILIIRKGADGKL